jgi:ribonuclease PH
MDHKENIKKDMKMKEFCRVLKSVFEQVIMLEVYPRS